MKLKWLQMVIAFPFLSGCANDAVVSKEDDNICNKLTDETATQQAWEALRPVLEFERESDGYKHTLEEELRFNTVSMFECGEIYIIDFVPKRLVDGEPTTTNAKKIIMDRASLKVLTAKTEGEEVV